MTNNTEDDNPIKAIFDAVMNLQADVAKSHSKAPEAWDWTGGVVGELRHRSPGPTIGVWMYEWPESETSYTPRIVEEDDDEA
jgi:hypothetical protein